MTDLAKDVARLLAIEEIKQVKAKYFFGLDHRDWDLWKREVWAPDGELHVPEFRPEPFTGWEAVIEYVSASTGDQVSVHHGHMPIIEFTSDTEAKVHLGNGRPPLPSTRQPALRWQQLSPRLGPLP